MNTVASSATSAVKLVLYTTGSRECSDAPDSAYLELDAAQARAIIDLLVTTTRFREEAHRAGLICLCYSVTAGTGERIPNFRLIQISLVDEAPLSDDQPVLQLPDEFSPDALPGHDECRVECHRIEIGHNSVRFTAMAKHGDERFTTADLELELLQAIAEARDDGLPRADLNSAHGNR